MKIEIRNDHVHIDGYVNAVERLSKPITERLGTFRERVASGTFKKALARAEDVRILENHDFSRNLGGIKDGNLHLEEDAIGLRASADIYDARAIEEAKAGDFIGWSFGFYPIDSRDTSEDGMPIKELHDIELIEVSLLNRKHTPAYDGTLVSVRDGEEKMILGESLFADQVDIREMEKQAEAQEEAVNEALAEIRSEDSDESENAQDETPEESNEVSSILRNARYKNMIALMKEA
jgi:HK97 family phage prohead protease